MMMFNERGVAMITVLFVGAALTAVASMAAFAGLSDMRASNDDRRGSEALAYSEAGVHRMILELKKGVPSTRLLRTSGCDLDGSGTVEPDEEYSITGNIGRGTFTARLEVFPADGLTLDQECADRALTTTFRDPKRFSIFSTGCLPIGCTTSGETPEARRVIQQVVDIRLKGLPIAFYTDTLRAAGNPKFSSLSVLSPGDAYRRDQTGFSGTDPFYTVGDFWPTSPNAASQVPAAMHVGGHINCQGSTKCPPSSIEHSVTVQKACNANRTTGSAPQGAPGQSQWDQSIDGGPMSSTKCAAWSGSPVNAPPTSYTDPQLLAQMVPQPDLTDEEYLLLRDRAIESGIYCFIPDSGSAECTKVGAPWNFPSAIQNGDLSGLPALPADFVAYFEYESDGLHGIDWKADWPLSGSMCDPNNLGFVTMIVRNGDWGSSGNPLINGALFLPEGDLNITGGPTINGTINVESMSNAGQSLFRLDDCWLQNMPGLFIQVTPIRWQEIDR